MDGQTDRQNDRQFFSRTKNRRLSAAEKSKAVQRSKLSQNSLHILMPD